MKKTNPKPRLNTGDKISNAARGDRTNAANIIREKAIPIPDNVSSFLPVCPKETLEIIARISPPIVPTVKLCKAWLAVTLRPE